MSDPVADYLKPDQKPVIPHFVTEAVKMEHASTQAGRPIFEDREFVKIIIPGIRGQTAFEPVNEEHKVRWPREYKAFKAGKELPLEGTPLSEWPSSHITKSRIEELAYFNVRTVEHLAALDDAKVMNLGMGARELRGAAQKFLEVARTGTGPLERLLERAIKAEAEVERLTAALTSANAEIHVLKAKEPANASA